MKVGVAYIKVQCFSPPLFAIVVDTIFIDRIKTTIEFLHADNLDLVGDDLKEVEKK